MVSTVRKWLGAFVAVICVAALVYSFVGGGLAGLVTSEDAGTELYVSQVSAAPYASEAQSGDLVDVALFLRMLNTGQQRFQLGMNEIDRTWNIAYVPMILESLRFLPQWQRLGLVRLISARTGQDFGTDFDAWNQWMWKQEFKPHRQYAQFKAAIYQRIDTRFAEYFQDTENATIRLDEIRWGGVKRDGIPPLKNPKMLRASEAKYLGDNNVVFGIELNGDARCYPKRILAWHEMFKDTIGGESVCGVY